MLFKCIPASPKEASRRYEAIDEVLAGQLRSGCAGAGVISTSSVKTWAHQFYLLRKEAEPIEPGRVQRVLDWYCANLKEEYIPQGWCGKTFRAKFSQIEAAMFRRHDRDLDVPVVSDDAKSIVQRLLYVQWPKGADAKLPGAVQKSLDNLLSFREVVKRLCGTYDRSSQTPTHGMTPQQTYTYHVYVDLCRDYDNTIERHFKTIWKQVHKWEEWSGNMASRVWNPRKDPVKSQLEGIAKSWGKIDQYVQLIEEYDKHESHQAKRK